MRILTGLVDVVAVGVNWPSRVLALPTMIA
jgi:hypothetical protein